MKYVRILAESKDSAESAPCLSARIGSWILRRVLPSANPDFETVYSGVTEWWIEVDEFGVPVREIGIARCGAVVAIAPFLDNVGLITDSSATFIAEPDDQGVRATFDEKWRSFEQKWIEKH